MRYEKYSVVSASSTTFYQNIPFSISPSKNAVTSTESMSREKQKLIDLSKRFMRENTGRYYICEI